jgi:pimeloyl-ACP methyl ester carboxylesterase
VAQFYERFAREQHSVLNRECTDGGGKGGWNVHVLSYSGHQMNARDALPSGDDGRRHGLAEQVAHKAAFLDLLMAEARAAHAVTPSIGNADGGHAVAATSTSAAPPSTSTAVPPAQFVLCGHSIGAWVCMQLIEQRPDLPVLHSVLAFPFLRFDLTRLQEWSIRLVFLLAPLILLALRLLALAPLAARKRVVAWWEGYASTRF